MKKQHGNIDFPSLLALLLIGLKLGGVIAWSWWWVLAPLWCGALLVLVIAFAAVGFDAVRKAADPVGYALDKLARLRRGGSR